jgi:hypothetical protein
MSVADEHFTPVGFITGLICAHRFVSSLFGHDWV